VKADPLAMTYDDTQYKRELNKPATFSLTKAEADAKFPLRAQDIDDMLDDEVDEPIPEPPPPKPKPSWDETEAEEDARVAREEKEFEDTFMAGRRARAENEREEKIRKSKERGGTDESNEVRFERWEKNLKEKSNRPWVDLLKQKRSTWDERALFDPVTMVKLVSHSVSGTYLEITLPLFRSIDTDDFPGRMIERYYYRDHLTEDNVYVNYIL
jgi:hypothetical protein